MVHEKWFKIVLYAASIRTLSSFMAIQSTKMSLSTWGIPVGTVYLGYLVIDLKRHVPIGETLNRVSIALRETQHDEHMYAFVQGDVVPHVHIHGIPRYANTPESFWGPMKIVSWPDASEAAKQK